MKSMLAYTAFYLAVIFIGHPLSAKFFWIYTPLFFALIGLSAICDYIEHRIQKEERPQ